MQVTNQRTGVYCILNLTNGKRYVGSTAVSLMARWRQHKSDLRCGRHKNRHLQTAWLKYGEESFEFIVLCLCDSQHCVRREQSFIDKFKSANRRYGYNLVPTAGSLLGAKHSMETKRLMSYTRKGVVKSAIHRQRLSEANRGKVVAMSIRKKISKTLTGRTIGPHSQEHKDRIKTSLMGHQVSLETKDKMRMACLKRWKNPFYRASMVAKHTGKKVSDETRRKMSESHKKRQVGSI